MQAFPPSGSTRRRFLRGGLAMAATWTLPLPAGTPAAAPTRLAMISDVHQDVIHDAPERLGIFLGQAREWKADGILEMGDFCIPKPENRAFADLFESFAGPRFHLIGNHELDDGHTREEVVAFHRMPGRYYAFDLGGIRGIALDGNDRPEGFEGKYASHLADDQIDWLHAELTAADKPVFVFSHQSLERPTCIRSQEKARAVIAAARHADGTRKVAACFNGHWHMDYAREIDGIPYIHINSASYYWVGEKFARRRYDDAVHERRPLLVNAVPYREPIFTLLEVDPAARVFRITARTSEWVGPSPRDMGQLYPGMDPDWVVPRQSAREGNWKAS